MIEDAIKHLTDWLDASVMQDIEESLIELVENWENVNSLALFSGSLRRATCLMLTSILNDKSV